MDETLNNRLDLYFYHSEPARRDWHYSTPGCRADMAQAELEASVDALGMYLHAQQDSYSHTGSQLNIGHIHKLHPFDIN